MTVSANSIVTPQTPFSRVVASATGNTDFTSPATATLLDCNDNTNGARITRLVVIPLATVTSASNCQVYATDGTDIFLIDSALMASGSTPGAAVANPKTDFGYSEDAPLILRAGWGLKVAPGQSQNVAFRCEGAFY